MSDPCGCCIDTGSAAHEDAPNRPGLSAVAYQLGTFASFRKALLDALSRLPALAGLRSRTSDDYTITAVELWAAVADVLTFYHDRIANEAFLGTATQRDSVLRIVRLIDYHVRPGTAATARLAFTLEPGTTATIAAGTRVQSVPAAGEQPQKFETLAALVADARLNRLRLFGPPAAAKPTAAGSLGGLAAPDPEALQRMATLTPGDDVLLFAPKAIEVLKVAAVGPRDDRMSVRWTTPIAAGAFCSAASGDDPACQAWRLGRTFRAFGFDAPPKVVVPYLVNGQARLAVGETATTWPESAELPLDARHAHIKPGAPLLIFDGTTTKRVTVKSVNERPVTLGIKDFSDVIAASGTVTVVTVEPALDAADRRKWRIFELLDGPLRFWEHEYPSVVATHRVFLPGRRVGWSTVEVGRTLERGATRPGIVLDVGDLPRGREVLLDDGAGDPVTATVADVFIVGSGVQFAATEGDSTTVARCGLVAPAATRVTVLASAAVGKSLVLGSAPHELTIRIGALPGRTITLTGLGGTVSLCQVATALQTAIRGSALGAPTYAKALVWCEGGVLLVAAGVAGDRVGFRPSPASPGLAALLGLDADQARFLDGVLGVMPDLGGATIEGKVRVAIGEGAPEDPTIKTSATTPAEFALDLHTAFKVVVKLTDDGHMLVLPPVPTFAPCSHLCVQLDFPGPLALAGASAMLLGNIAAASHGETVRAEIVGDGDAARAFQTFTLRKKPVTYVPAATSGGAASSLRLAIDGVLWTERATLYGARPTDEVYITRIADDGTVSVKFGDGVTGARLPTGRRNVVATYRQGVGLSGRVGAGKLTNLLDRALGVKGVTNPAAADGGADPETIDRARTAAPGTVRTFGRAVALRDFADASLMAGEVAKVAARLVWNGRARAIHLTVAAQGGALLSADGLARIAATLAAERDPNHRLLIANYVPVPVVVEASITVDPRHETAVVLAASRAALLASLSFAARAIAQPLYVSDIYAVLQGVAGVDAVDVDRLDLKSTDPTFRSERGVDDTKQQPQPRLLLLPARPGGAGVILPGELATVEVPAQDVVLRASGGI